MRRVLWMRKVVAATVAVVSAVCAPIYASEPGEEPQAIAPAGDGLRYEVVEVRGAAKWGALELRPDAEAGWQQVRVGDQYGGGIQIFCGLRSKVKLVQQPANPPTVIMVESMTLASIDELYRRQDEAVARLGLAYGAIRAGVAEGELRSNFQIRSPVATLSKRGTWDFRMFVERGTGRWNMWLAQSGLLEALQHSTGETRFVRPGQYMTEVMRRWIETARFDRQISLRDLFGLKGTDEWFNLNNSGGLGVVLPGGNLLDFLKKSGHEIPPDAFKRSGYLLDQLLKNDPQVSQLRLAQALRDRLNQLRLTLRRPDGDFGVGYSSPANARNAVQRMKRHRH